MKPPAIHRFSRTCRQREHGVTMILVAVAMVAIIGMAALSIDVITLYLAREEAQRSADAAALAAARVISISGLTGDPANNSSSWQAICGGPTSPATLAATAVATQSAVGGTVANVSVTYSASGATGGASCSGLPAAFGVDPLVTVQITRSSLPTFFSRIWGNTGNSISATATAEAFNPSNSGAVSSGGPGGVIPVQPSCVKPWMIPNRDPYNASATCSVGTNPQCGPFVSLADGSIQRPGILTATSTGVIGENFTLVADCGSGTPCVLIGGAPPQANTAATAFTPNLEYLPGLVQNPSVAVPSCAVGTGANADYEPAVAGCDQSTVYQCGVQSSVASPANAIDLSENPGGTAGDTAIGISCLISQSSLGSTSGQDFMLTNVYPYQITAGTTNPNVAVRGDVVTSSNSIVSLPIYDDTTVGTIGSGTTPVTIVGFLQVFVNQVNADGSLNVTVLNVAGCGNNTANRPVTGTSPVPIRLITSP
jgi:Flp pilus assembly protein TadG